MSSKTLSTEATSVRLAGRPKGVPTHQSQRILDAWEDTKQINPKLNNSGLMDVVAEIVFGPRLNLSVLRRNRERVRRTLQRHGKL
jgi:hypothetical protein